MEVTRIFSFSAAHHLTEYHGACERPHGHTYRLGVTVSGPVQKNGLVLDFVELKRIVEASVLSKLDHNDLNNMFKNPSAENTAIWVWGELKDALRQAQGDKKESGLKIKLVRIQLWEGDNTYVTYEGN
jgi:6-pyruvoyltetrahydropterin/6-carboxytetrahydropterin synthase